MAKWTLITWSENQTSSSCGAANSPETGIVCLTGADNDSPPHPPPPLPLPPPPPQLFLPLCLSRSCWHVERRQPCDRWRSPTSTSWTFRLPWPVSRWCCSSSRVCTVTVTPTPTLLALPLIVLARAAWHPSKLLQPCLALPAVTDGGLEGSLWHLCCLNIYICEGVSLRSG